MSKCVREANVAVLEYAALKHLRTKNNVQQHTTAEKDMTGYEKHDSPKLQIPLMPLVPGSHTEASW